MVPLIVLVTFHHILKKLFKQKCDLKQCRPPVAQTVATLYLVKAKSHPTLCYFTDIIYPKNNHSVDAQNCLPLKCKMSI